MAPYDEALAAVSDYERRGDAPPGIFARAQVLATLALADEVRELRQMLEVHLAPVTEVRVVDLSDEEQPLRVQKSSA